jgi:hypothetical protein
MQFYVPRVISMESVSDPIVASAILAALLLAFLLIVDQG